MYRYSLIIPHKNIPDLLQRCIDSIPKREDMQLIIVDDNSDPSVVDFAHFPGLGLPHTEVYFDKTGKGAGHARNVGLQHAQGTWIIFSDADDTFYTDNFSTLLDTEISDGTKVVFWCINECYSDGHIVTHKFFDGQGLVRIDSKVPLTYSFAPWRKMVRHDHILAHQLQFEEVMASNDVMFYVRLLVCTDVQDMLYFPLPVYAWLQRDQSLMHTATLSNALCRFNVALRANRLSLQSELGLIDGTSLYLMRIKKFSTLAFLYGFFKEWSVLGIHYALNDYETCFDNAAHPWVKNLNIFYVVRKIKRRIKSLL